MATKEFYTERELLELAAGSKGVVLRDKDSRSEAIKSYPLNEELLKQLKEEGVDVRYEQQYLRLKYSGGHWIYRVSKEEGWRDFRIDLEVNAHIRQELRGVLLAPHIWGCGCHGCSVEDAPHKYMFRTLVECDKNPPQVAEDMVLSEGDGLVVGWSELGLGGLRTLGEVFREFFGGNEVIEHIARKEYVFDPLPYPRFSRDKTIFVVEPAQPRIIQTWREQLKEYRSKLVA